MKQRKTIIGVFLLLILFNMNNFRFGHPPVVNFVIKTSASRNLPSFEASPFGFSDQSGVIFKHKTIQDDTDQEDYYVKNIDAENRSIPIFEIFPNSFRPDVIFTISKPAGYRLFVLELTIISYVDYSEKSNEYENITSIDISQQIDQAWSNSLGSDEQFRGGFKTYYTNETDIILVWDLDYTSLNINQNGIFVMKMDHEAKDIKVTQIPNFEGYGSISWIDRNYHLIAINNSISIYANYFTQVTTLDLGFKIWDNSGLEVCEFSGTSDRCRDTIVRIVNTKFAFTLNPKNTNSFTNLKFINFQDPDSKVQNLSHPSGTFSKGELPAFQVLASDKKLIFLISWIRQDQIEFWEYTVQDNTWGLITSLANEFDLNLENPFYRHYTFSLLPINNSWSLFWDQFSKQTNSREIFSVSLNQFNETAGILQLTDTSRISNDYIVNEEESGLIPTDLSIISIIIGLGTIYFVNRKRRTALKQ